MAEKLKDNKDDRVDGRRALNDFILEHESIVHTKSVKKAEAQKLQHQQNLKESKYFMTHNNIQIRGRMERCKRRRSRSFHRSTKKLQIDGRWKINSNPS